MILLDTHILVWLDKGSRQLGKETRIELDKSLQKNALAVSAITFWELAMLVNKGRIELPPIRRWRSELLNMGLIEIPIDGACGIHANELVDFHPDPADRLIVATAIENDATLATADERILNWSEGMSRLDGRV